jgi:hypothetical protein
MSTKLYIGNLSYTTGDQELREAFAPHGNVLSASVVIDRDTGQSRGFGFVEYGSADEAQRATDAVVAAAAVAVVAAAAAAAAVVAAAAAVVAAAVTAVAIVAVAAAAVGAGNSALIG